MSFDYLRTNHQWKADKSRLKSVEIYYFNVYYNKNNIFIQTEIKKNMITRKQDLFRVVLYDYDIVSVIYLNMLEQATTNKKHQKTCFKFASHMKFSGIAYD